MNKPAHRLSDEKLLEILSLSQNATAIYTGEDIIIQMANDAMISFWGKDRSIIGMPLAEAVQELKDQSFIGLLKNVWRTGITYEAKDTAATLLVGSSLQTFYFDFVYRAIKDEQGNTDCILHTATDVTELNLSRKIIAEANEQKAALNREQELNEQLATANEELLITQERLHLLNNQLENRVAKRTNELVENKAALQQANEELAATNEELRSINEELHQIEIALLQANQSIRASEVKLDQIIVQLPSPIVLLKGPNQVVEKVNDALLQFWDKEKEEVMGRPMLEIFPELKSQPFPAQWKHVYETGETIINREKPVMFNREEGIRIFYVDYHYQALRGLDGEITDVLATVIDNTDKIVARNKIKKAQQQLEQALNSANLGTWAINITTGKVELSPRFKTLFGFLEDREYSIEEVVGAIDEEYRQLNNKAVEDAIKNGASASIEYALHHAVTGEKIWVRAFGKVFLDENNQPETFSGLLQDITEQKVDDQRKNDFINMVSHELKTPLTSMSGYIQLLQNRAKNSTDSFNTTTLEKSYNQIKKMTTLINGFLNMSRLESGKIYLDITSFNIETLIQEVVEESSLVFSGHQIHFAAYRPITVMADHDKIGQVITNFISNAVKYAFSSKTIDVACQETKGQVTISVTDYGNGIQPEDQEKIFERYYRIENDKKQTIAGFGIGLYLCAEIVARHHGQIGVKSEVGKGSTFWFSLPVQ